MMTWISTKISTLLGWVTWGKCLGVVVLVAILGGCVSAIRMMPASGTPVLWGETPTAEPTVEPTAKPIVEPTAERKAKVVKEVVVVVTATSQPPMPTAQPTSEPTAEPTVVPTAMPIAEGTANACGFTLPPDWVETKDGMSGKDRKANAEISVPAGEVAFIWATKVNQIQGRVLVVQKGPFVGNYELTDGAYRVGHLADMSDSGIGAAAGFVQAWLACSYGPEWSPVEWSPPNQ